MWSGMKEDGTGIDLHSLTQFKNIFSWFHDCLNKVKEDMKLTCDELKIVSSWANLNKTNQSFHSHQHPNCFLAYQMIKLYGMLRTRILKTLIYNLYLVTM